MKANELRIWNLVKSNNPIYRHEWLGKTLSILEIKDESVSVIAIDELPCAFVGGQFLKYIEPIKLTEEWLVKLGAIDRNKEERDRFNFKEINWYFGFTEPYGDFRIYQHPDSFKYWLDQYHTIEIKYVHQLQNIYFALTGEELTIK